MRSTDRPLAALSDADARIFGEIGPVWGSNINQHRDLVVATYSRIVAAADNSGVAVERNVAYGAHPRQVLDVFTPPPDALSAGRRQDVVLFVHGGAFIRGSKSSNGHVYDNVCYWLARQGYTALNVEYRLAPEAQYPGGADDVARAVDWATAELPGRGIVPRRVFLIGHSAGGTHVGTCVFDPAFPSPPACQIAGVVLISARLRADIRPDNPNSEGVKAYFGSDPALYEQRSPVTHAHRSQVPLLIAIAEFENPHLDLYGAEFFERASAARPRKPRFLQMKKHNHTSIVAHFNSGEDLLGREIVEFFDGIRS